MIITKRRKTMSITTTNQTTKDRLLDFLSELAVANGTILKTRKGDNLGPALGRVFVWQETKRIAEEELKEAWKAVQDAELIPTDDVLREEGQGEEKILLESSNFSVITKVDKPRDVFSRDKFITLVAKKFKLDQGRLEALAQTCMVPSAAPLKKRVLEV
jgi:hypothetical protein